MAGKYTGHVDADENPDGEGVMRYEFGLVAEGKWIKGRLIDECAGGGMMMPGPTISAVANGGMSVAPGMNVGANSGATVTL